MIYLLLFYEFFKVGLFAIGGGLVTVPFLFDLSAKYSWFTTKELADMIAISESMPGPLGVNMATFGGFHAAGIWGGIIATLGLVTPSVIVIIIVAKLLDKYQCNIRVQRILSGIRPAVIALILFAGLQIAKLAIFDVKTAIVFAVFLGMIHFWKKSPIFYLVLAALPGLACSCKKIRPLMQRGLIFRNLTLKYPMLYGRFQEEAPARRGRQRSFCAV